MNKETLRSLLPAEIDLIYHDEVASTNTYAKQLVRQGRAANTVLVAAAVQTAGRGRRGRDFYSPAGGIYMSLILRHSLPPETLPLITPAAAVAVRQGIKKICRMDCGIKWVNDIELDGKKVCGILTELEGDYCIIGIGVNWLSGEALLPELASIAGSLYTSPPEERPEALAAEIIRRLCALTSALPGSTAFLAEYSAHSTLLGQEVTVHTPTESYCATATSIDSSGRLIVRSKMGELIALQTGEVSVRKQK